jgi:hypothetical protein
LGRGRELVGTGKSPKEGKEEDTVASKYIIYMQENVITKLFSIIKIH